MAGRGSLFVAFGLLTVVGCTKQQQVPQTHLLNNRAMHTETSPPPGAEIKKGEDLPKRTPKSTTCAAFGDFCAAEAASAKQQPAIRDQRRTQGIKAYQQALDIDPKNLKAALNLARLQSSGGDHDGAIATLQKALKHHGDNAAVWCELGMIQARKKDWGAALTSLGKASELEPANRQFTTIRGYTYARAGRYDEALNCFQQIDGEAKAHYNLARMLSHMEQPQLSRAHLQLALAKNPELECARDMLAQLNPPATAPAQANRATPAAPTAPTAAPEPTIIQTAATVPAPAPAKVMPSAATAVPTVRTAKPKTVPPAPAAPTTQITDVEPAELPDLLPPPPMVFRTPR